MGTSWDSPNMAKIQSKKIIDVLHFFRYFFTVPQGLSTVHKKSELKVVFRKLTHLFQTILLPLK